MKKVDLKRVVGEEWVSRLLVCNGCRQAYVIESGDKIEFTKGKTNGGECCRVVPVLICECGNITKHWDDLEKWDGYEANEDSEQLNYFSPYLVSTWLVGKLKNTETPHMIRLELNPFGNTKYCVELIVSEGNMKQVYKAFGGKL